MQKALKIIKIILIIILIGFILYGGFLYFKIKANKPIEETKNNSLTDEQLKKQIGQMLMVGFRGIEAPKNYYIYNVIKEVGVGSIILSDYDVPSSSFPRNIINPEQTKKLVSDLQGYSETPLFIAIDVEGGSVNRLKQKYGFISILSAEKMGQDKTLKTTNDESLKLAEELKGLGINMNLSPVVDVNINPKNPVIGSLGRSFSSDSNVVVDNARVFIQNHIDNNIITVEKHFPGHGSSTKDSHLGMVDVTDTYKEEELYPYQKLNEGGLLNAVMTAHVINKNIDKDYPATLSKAFLQDILRNQIGFRGIIISDDIQMSAISDNYGFEEAIIMAINAGCDIVNVYNNSPSGYDEQAIYKARDAIFNAVKEKRIEEKRITESYNRILELKKKFKIGQASTTQEFQENIGNTNGISAQYFELIGEPNTITFGQAVEYAKYVEDIIGIRPAFLLGVLKNENNLVKEFGLCYVTNFENGDGIKEITNEKFSKVMKPDRDIPGFLEITKELGRDPSKTLVTCPMSFGWGGAMGVADFIPFTWIKYKDRIKNITGRPADPWNIKDSFLAAGLYLSESGAASKTKQGEWNAAMIYFSGSTKSGYNWYADDALALADKIQIDIEAIEKAK
jgi:beta-N-acetylhexosaminidase